MSDPHGCDLPRPELDATPSPDRHAQSGTVARAAAEGHHAPGVADGSLRRLLCTVPFVSAMPQLGFAASGYFLALQVQAIDEATKVGNLAIVHGAGAAAAMIAQPLVGVLSDRTRTRLGARAPWIVTGTLIGSVGMITAGLSQTVALLVLAAMAVQFGFNAAQGPLTAILPDRVPPAQRGRYSTFAGLGTITAAILGPILASMFTARIPLGYVCSTGVILVVVVVFVALNPDTDNRTVARPVAALMSSIKGGWIDPRRHPDFAWAFLGRLLILGGYYMVLTYHLYIAQGFIGLSEADAARLVPLIGAVALPGFLVAIAISGPYSDRTGRRKPLALAGGLVIAVAPLVPLASPTVAGMMISGVVVTIGFGIYTAVDQALVSEILPSKDDFAKDLGIINIASALPNVLAPVLAAGIVTLSGSYGAIYPVAAAIAAAGALAVLPIKGVR
ncbi:MFS transporter [Nocardia sp. CWNU-33]|uniref:MFS transporter n=1 Tax=Nocardia sp. CWNU-33 TaxID=3392117 RepID=UPI00398F255A